MSLRAVSVATTLALIVGGVAFTAAPAVAATPKGSISGVISSEGDVEGSSIGTDARATLLKWRPTYKEYIGVKTVSADAAGKYKFTGLAAGRYSVSFSTTSHHWLEESWNNVYINSTDVLPTAIDLKAGKNVVASPQLAVGASISGVVSGSDTEGGELNEVVVTVHPVETQYSFGAQAVQSTSDDVEGYTAQSLHPGTYKLSAETDWQDAHISGWYGGTDEASASLITVAPGEELLDFDLSLTLGGTLSGTVTTSKSGEVSIDAIAYDSEGARVARADVYEDGEYAITKLPSGTYRIGYESNPFADGKIVPEFYEDVTTLDAAQVFTVTGNQSIGGIDANVEVAEKLTTTPTPKISGKAVVGSTLTAKAGTWGPTGVTLAYEWFVGGESAGTGATYTLAPADAGKYVYVLVEGSLEGYGSTLRQSTALLTAKGTITAVTPKITGTAKVGSTLTAVTGTWKPAATAFTYTWLRDGKAITDATSATYTLVAADKGKKISLKVTGATAGYTSKSSTSASSKPVAAGTLVAPAIPSITGTVRVAETLTAVTEAWAPEGTTLSYQWNADKKAITGATSSTLVVPGTVAGKKLTVTVTGKKSGYTTLSKTSVATVAVAKADLVVGSAPTIAGEAAYPATLTASAEGWESTTKLSYQWLRDGSKISGATKATYAVARADRGHTVTVTLTATRTGYNTLTATTEDSRAISAIVATVQSEPFDSIEDDDYAIYVYKTTPASATVAGGEYFEFHGTPGFFAGTEDDVFASVTWAKGSKIDGKDLAFTVSEDASTLRVKIPTGSTLATMKAKKKAGFAIELQVINFTDGGSTLVAVFTTLKF